MKGPAQASSLLGVLLVATYVVMCSGREIYLSSLLKQVPLFLLLFLSFGLATLFFLLIQVPQGKGLGIKLRASWMDVVKINFTTALMWGAFLYALKWIQPAVVSSLNGAMGPISSLALGLWMIQGQKTFKSDYVAATGVLVSVAYMITMILAGRHADGSIEPTNIVLGLAASVVSGVVTALNNIYAKRLSKAGWSAGEVLAVRFGVLILISGAFTLGSSAAVDFGTVGFINFLAVALLGMVLPIYILQLGIARSDVNVVALLIAVGPLLTLALQTWVGKVALSAASLVGILGVTLSVVLGIFLRLRRERTGQS